MPSHPQASGPQRIILAMTGASGAAYALGLLQALTQSTHIETHLIISNTAASILELEAGISAAQLSMSRVIVHEYDNSAAPPASGSWIHHGMVICPCSMASLATIRHGTGHNLIHRAADVTLKENRPLILVPRETPLNIIHLENMLGLARAGAQIVPACPGFYHRPETIQDLINHLVGRILDQLGVENQLITRWGMENDLWLKHKRQQA